MKYTFIVLALLNGEWKEVERTPGLAKPICELSANMSKKIYKEAQNKHPEIKGHLQFICEEEDGS